MITAFIEVEEEGSVGINVGEDSDGVLGLEAGGTGVGVVVWVGLVELMGREVVEVGGESTDVRKGNNATNA
jgi:repressor of nif and glnA expression